MITVSNVSLSFGGQLLFKDVDLKFTNGNRYGIIGANGAGKSTFLKILCGEIETTTGEVVISKEDRLSVLRQDHFAFDEYTVLETVIMGNKRLYEIMKEKDELYAKEDFTEEDGDRAGQLESEFAELNGWEAESDASKLIQGLGLSEDILYSQMSTLSGNEKVKVLLAQALFGNPDIILMDEPTNHLDITACEWLEKFLTEYKGAYIVISHDRYFLDKVTDTTFEMENRTLREYKGNYTRYLELKSEAREAQQRVYDRTVKEINRIEGIVEQQKRWGQEHNFITAASKQKQAGRLKETLEKPEDLPEAIKFTFRAKEGGANDVLIAKGLSKSFDGTAVFTNAELDIKKNTTTFILGENGCGKTTLLKILTGEYQADSGEYKFGNNIQFGYYDQAQTDLDPSKTVIDEVWDRYPGMTQTQVRSALAQFLFKGDDVFKNVGKLSGGEKARVSLLKLMLSKANMLLLDEPTNHLDIHSREALENALASYGGTLLIVSHDRYLINKLADRIVWLGKTGTVNIDGNYDRYIELKEAKAQSEQAVQVKVAEGKKNDYKERKERESTLRKLSGALKRCEQAIDEIGLKTAELAQQMSQPEIATDYEKTSALAQEIEALKEKEEALTAEWMELSEQIEAFT